jgi:hypothetical protein
MQENTAPTFFEEIYIYSQYAAYLEDVFVQVSVSNMVLGGTSVFAFDSDYWRDVLTGHVNICRKIDQYSYKCLQNNLS